MTPKNISANHNLQHPIMWYMEIHKEIHKAYSVGL
jgi:hypothetical protein